MVFAQKHWVWASAGPGLPVVFPQTPSTSAPQHRSAVSGSTGTAAMGKRSPAVGNIFRGDNIFGGKNQLSTFPAPS